MKLTQQRRKLDRLSVRAPVLFGVVFPQDTFTPFYEETCVWNLSEAGGLVTVTLPERIIQKALLENHYCRIQFSIDGMPTRMLGRLVWAEKDDGGRSYTHRLGIEFSQISPSDLSRLQRFISQSGSYEQKQSLVDTLCDDVMLQAG